MEDICIIAYLMILSNLQLIAGQLPDTESLRNVTHCDINSALNIACGTDEVIVLHSIKLAYNVKCETTCCNTYDSSHCFAGFDADVTREFRRTCSGRQTCTVPSIQNTADFCSFGVKPVSYVFLQYYCIPENRKIAICSTGKTLTSDGPPVYIASANYPDVTIRSTSCACTIEANSCASSITLYEADVDLYLDTSNCLQNVVFKNGTDRVLATIGCESYYTEYITSRKINSHYTKIDFDNNSTATQEGIFFLGLKASEDGVSFSISCSSVPEHWCVGCGPLQNIKSGILELRDNDDTSYGAIADVSCNKGYETNTSTISCQANNKWQDVVCTAKDCGPAPTVEFGNITLNGTTRYGSTANVECQTGYEPNKSIITCQASGKWETPECNIKDCGPAPTVEFGDITLDGTTTFGTTATVECQTGYQSNKTTVTCQASGQWETPGCIIKDCGPAQTVEFGNITLDGATTFGSIATVECETGYQPSKPIVTCVATGHWETAACNKKDCGPAPTVEFGNITIDGTTTFGSTATFFCETGYEQSKPKIACLASGQWETAECHKKVTDTTLPSDRTQTSSADKIIIIVIVVLVVLILIQFSMVTFFQCNIYNIRKKASGHVEMMKRVMVVIAGSVPVIGFIAIYLSGSLYYTEMHKVNQKYTQHTTETVRGSKSVPPVDKPFPTSQLDEQHRYKQKTDNNNGDRPYDDVCGMNTKSGGNNSINLESVYDGLKPLNGRGNVEMKEHAYDILKPKDSVDIKDTVYTNLKI